MALNEVIYLPNPAAAQTKTVGTVLTAFSGATNTLITATASTYVRVRSFCIQLTATGDAVSDFVYAKLKIGSGYYTVTLATPSAATLYTTSVSSADLGFDGAWIQGGETITLVVEEVGGGALTTPKASVSVALEEFTA